MKRKWERETDMSKGNYFVITFVTGGYGNRYANKKAAMEYARAANSYAERTQGQRLITRIEEYQGWEKHQDIAV